MSFRASQVYNIRIINQPDAIDVKVGAHCTVSWPWNSTVRTDLDIYTGFIPTQHMTTPVAAVTVYSAPDDGRKGRPKHVEHTCSC